MKRRIPKIVWEAVLSVVIAIVIGVGAFYFGYTAGTETPESIIVKGVTNIGDADVTADFDTFWQAWKFIKNEHVDGEKAEDQDLVYGSIKGLVGALKDENTVFFPPEDAEKFEEDVNGTFGGIGMEIGIRDDQLVIIAPLKNSPAERAGLKSADQILEIDNQSTANLNVSEAVKLIRGEAGTIVKLSIFRKDWASPKDFSITREIIQVPTLEAAMIGDDILHVELYSFNRNAPFLFYQSMIQVIFGGAKGVLLDLRNNPGGFLEVAVDLAGWFLDRGKVVVTEQFRSGEEIVFRASGNEALKDVPVVVLMNNGSASASEILAGALRDQRGAQLIGEKSFGKGSVQELKNFRDNSSLKLTVAKWLLPSGNVIEKNGLEPDIEVSISEKDAEAGKDPQLDKAVEVLQSLLQ